MTCVAGYFDRKNKIVYLGGDSCGSNGYTQAIYEQQKVFHSKDTPQLIMGLCGSFNFQGLQYEALLDELTLLKDGIDREYLVTKFIPKLKELTQKYNVSDTKNGASSTAGPLLFGYRDKMFIIQSDYSLIEPVNNYAAIGSGQVAAQGAFHALETLAGDMHPIDRIKFALSAAEDICIGVRKPFTVINTGDKEIIRIE